MRFQTRLAFLALGLAAVSTALLVACGGDDNNSSSAATATRPAASNTTAPAAAATNTTTAPPAATGPVAVAIADFSFTPNAITARAGQPITINVTNTGNASHTFTVQGVTGADTGTLAKGESKTITFTPTAAGRLPFFCNIHGASVMSGAITVQ